MDKDEEEINRYLAKEQNALDHLARKIYGGRIKFDNLSPFGQNTIEALAREKALISDPDPELRHAKTEVASLRYELNTSQEKLAEALRENQELWEENEELRIALYDTEEDRALRSKGRRQDRTT